MKYLIAFFALGTFSANAFSVPPQQHPLGRKDMSLYATSAGTSNSAGWLAATVFAGWTMATAPAALAIVPRVDMILPDVPTMVVAKGAYQPEEGYDATSLALPSYNVKSDDLMVGKAAEKQTTPTAKKFKTPSKALAAPKNESESQKAAREAKEAKAAERAAEKEAEARAKKAAEFERLQRDLEKIAAKKAEKAAAQAKRIEFRESQSK